jgi:glycerophosphoryl diester phosphodiesterase
MIAEEGGQGYTLQGLYGYDSNMPDQPLSFQFKNPLPKKKPFEILAHRGGARNVDFLPVSENTTDILKMAARLGATGVEIDVRLTKDGIPVIFHDSFLSIHTVQHKLWGGLIHNYTLEELQTVELRKGGRVPTLEDCLRTILYQTPLETVWLDIKKECDLHDIKRLQHIYMNEAAAIGRTLNIYIGIPDKQILGCFKNIPDHLQTPSLVELDPADVHEVQAEVWAPQYTGGTQEEEVARMHEAGKKVFVWSLDNKMMIDWYVDEGDFDGLITNTPTVAAFWYFTSDSKIAHNKDQRVAIEKHNRATT